MRQPGRAGREVKSLCGLSAYIHIYIRTYVRAGAPLTAGSRERIMKVQRTPDTRNPRAQLRAHFHTCRHIQ